MKLKTELQNIKLDMQTQVEKAKKFEENSRNELAEKDRIIGQLQQNVQ